MNRVFFLTYPRDNSVILEKDQVVAWHKTPTTPNIQDGVEAAIEAVVSKANLTTGRVDSVKIGTTVCYFGLLVMVT